MTLLSVIAPNMKAQNTAPSSTPSLEQLKAMGITIALALIGTAAIATIVRVAIGLRVAPEIERQGIDINLHGEEGYITSG